MKWAQSADERDGWVRIWGEDKGLGVSKEMLPRVFDPDYRATPVVIFSSSTNAEDRVKARELGAEGFVEKPTSATKFGEVVDGVRERWMGRGERLR